jgi:hypothetical protein
LSSRTLPHPPHTLTCPPAGQEGTGLVDLGSFCRLLRVDRSPFVERLFAMFDIDNDDLIDLKEFIVGACAYV